MKQTRNVLALLLIFALLALTGCRSENVGPERPSASPAPAVSEEPSDSQLPETASTPPAESESQPGGATQPTDETAVLNVDGQELAAVRYDSPLGYSIVYPEDQITLNAWEDGDNYLVSEARGTYLAVSQVAAANISEAAAVIQFENAVEDEPKGFIFGSGGYAGVRMVQKAGGLTQEFILVEENDVIFLIERAVYTGGEEAAPLLQAMLDSFTIQ